MNRTWSVALGLAVLTLLVYGRTVTHEFVLYDDPDYVTRNAVVQQGLTAEGLAWAFGRLHGEATYWHPLTWLSHMLDCQLFGLRAAGHHLVSVLFHAVNAGLVFLVFQRMTGALWRSAILAALFALHPLQVDTVAWVTERKNVLSACFWLLTMGAWLRWAERPAAGRYALVLLLMALGLMAKPILVTLPCALLLLDYWPLRRFSFSPAAAPGSGVACAPRSVGLLVAEKLPLLALAAASMVITIRAHEGLGFTQTVHGLPLGLRLENALVSYGRYLGKALWPSKLAVLYPHPGAWPDEWVLGSGVLVTALSAAALWRARRAPYLAVGWFWFLGVLVPAIGVVQVGVQAMADRFAYVPLLGLFLAVVWGVAELSARWPRGRVVLVTLSAMVLLACVVVTSVQLGHWRNSITLFSHAVAVTEKNFVMHYDLGVALLEAGRTEEAQRQFAEAVRIRPDYAEAHLQLGLVLLAQEKPAEALDPLGKAARLKPAWPEPLRGLGQALARQGKADEAIAQYTAALQVAPQDVESHAQLAVVLSGQNRVADALRHYEEALRLRPDAPEILNNLAWLRATHPQAEFRNGAEAVRLAERACELTRRKEAVLVGTLAAAYAEAGRFPEAVQAAEEAMALASTAGQTNLALTNQKLLQLYRAGQAHRDVAE
jgi:tetratricopeptide (TPR) repeat protein